MLEKAVSQFKGHEAGGILSYLEEAQHFVLFRPSTNWMSPPTLETAETLLSPLIQTLSSPRITLTDIPRIILKTFLRFFCLGKREGERERV